MRQTIIVFGLLLVPVLAFADADSHREATVELLDAMRSDEIIDQMHAQFEPIFTSAADEMNLSDEEREIYDRHQQHVLTVMRETMNWSRMEPYMIEAYMNVYTEQEIREITAFYNSPAGQKMLDRMPQLMDETMRVTQQMMEDFLPRMAELQAELAAELERL